MTKKEKEIFRRYMDDATRKFLDATKAGLEVVSQVELQRLADEQVLLMGLWDELNNSEVGA